MGKSFQFGSTIETPSEQGGTIHSDTDKITNGVYHFPNFIIMLEYILLTCEPTSITRQPMSDWFICMGDYYISEV